jgi:hypothetical protein
MFPYDTAPSGKGSSRKPPGNPMPVSILKSYVNVKSRAGPAYYDFFQVFESPTKVPGWNRRFRVSVRKSKKMYLFLSFSVISVSSNRRFVVVKILQSVSYRGVHLKSVRLGPTLTCALIVQSLLLCPHISCQPYMFACVTQAYI